MRLTNGQVANHEHWMVRCSPHAPGFSREQSTVRQHTPSTPFHTLNLPLSEKTADVPCTYTRNLPPPSFLNTNFVGKEGIHLTAPRIRTRASAVGGRCHNHHATTNSRVPNFIVYLLPLLSPGLQPHPSTRWGQGRRV